MRLMQYKQRAESIVGLGYRYIAQQTLLKTRY